MKSKTKKILWEFTKLKFQELGFLLLCIILIGGLFWGIIQVILTIFGLKGLFVAVVGLFIFAVISVLWNLIEENWIKATEIVEMDEKKNDEELP